MAKVEAITVEVHASDILMHNVFKKLAQEIYAKSGVKVTNIEFNWYESVDFITGNSKFPLLNVEINSTK